MGVAVGAKVLVGAVGGGVGLGVGVVLEFATILTEAVLVGIAAVSSPLAFLVIFVLLGSKTRV